MQAFGDSFDLYATMADPIAGYWDSGFGVAAANTLVAGRFAGSQAYSIQSSPVTGLVKSSGQNDAVHHIVCAFRQTAALSGTTLGFYFQLTDVSTNQVCVVFRSDGAILLTSATPAGTVLDTYTGAVTAANTWFAFEFEVVINNTTGSWAVRKNGNTSNDHALGSLNTRPGTNSYANKLTVGMNATVNAQQIDDLLWRSDPSAVPFVGDIRAYVRMPASDAQAQWTRSASTQTVTPFATGTSVAFANGTARYSAFTAPLDGTVATVIQSVATGYTGNLKGALFASSGSAPTTVLGSATPISNPVAGNNTFTFSPPVAVTKGTQYYFGTDSDTSSGQMNVGSGSTAGFSSGTAYASFPAASPSVTASWAPVFSAVVTPTSNATFVKEIPEDGVTSYVFDGNVGDADFYAVAALSGTPLSTVCVTTRGFLEKSDTGSRSAAVQLKSGATTVTSTSTALGTAWGWLWRTDLVDPATSAAWTAAGVNNATIGPTVTA